MKITSKSLKAILISIDKKFEKTQNIENLLNLIKEEGIEIPDIIQEAKLLTRHAVTTRYPDDYISVDNKEYKQALNIAKKVVKWAKLLIKKRPNELF
ncbi:MAG: HEPN domain-containing protein [Bacteroidota bacterium]